MNKFKVTVERSASEIATLEVVATTQEAAEFRIGCALNGRTRTSLDILETMKGIKIIEIECYPDEESSWEVV